MLRKGEIAVRCCCTPQKVLGYLPRPVAATVGMTVNYPQSPESWSSDFKVLTFEIARWSEIDIRIIDAGQSIESRSTGLALKREGTTVEELRHLRGFREAE